MNNGFYMTNGSTLMVENDSLFSPISVLHYQYYDDLPRVLTELKKSTEVQCIPGIDIPFGTAQQPGLMDYADGIDTVAYLLTL